MRRVAWSSLLAFLSLGACGASTPADTAITPERAPSPKPFVQTAVATFDSPWAMTFLPDGRILVTEKDGTLKLGAPGGAMVSVAGTPTVDSDGQGGLMDVVLHPDFAQNGIVYLSWSDRAPGGKRVALGRGRLVGQELQCIRAPCPAQARLDGFETIFRANSTVSGSGHFSGRIAFSPDGQYLFFTNGERQKFTPAQDPKVTLGKVLRLTPDGTAAAANPLAAQGFAPEIWSYGHRNLLGLAFDAQGRLWEQEMGPRGGDEVNLIAPAETMAGRSFPMATITMARRSPTMRRGPRSKRPKSAGTPQSRPPG